MQSHADRINLGCLERDANSVCEVFIPVPKVTFFKYTSIELREDIFKKFLYPSRLSTTAKIAYVLQIH